MTDPLCIADPEFDIPLMRASLVSFLRFGDAACLRYYLEARAVYVGDMKVLQPLEEQLIAKVREWFARASPRVSGDEDFASLTITLMDFQYDEADAKCLSLSLEEKYGTDSLIGTIEE